MEIVSLDKERIFTSTEGNNTVYLNKKTSKIELENLKKAREYICSKTINIKNYEYSLQIPQVKNWNEEQNIIQMEYFNGMNLEIMLRDCQTRKNAIIILNKLLEFILINNFYWVDFSPRNILINERNKQICFVDFEKGLSFEYHDLINFFRNHVFEDYSSFLFYSERILDGKDIFKTRVNEKSILVNKNNIKIKIVKAMINLLNYPTIITQDKFLEIYRMFMIAELPKKINNGIIFPRVELEEILELKNQNNMAYNEYANRIIQLVEEKKKERKIIRY